MRADNEFLLALANWMIEVADKTNDPETENELRCVSEMLVDAYFRE